MLSGLQILFKEKEKESAKAASEAAATNSGSSPPDGSTADGANEVLLAGKVMTMLKPNLYCTYTTGRH